MEFKLMVDGDQVALPRVLNDVKLITTWETHDGKLMQIHHTFTHEAIIVDVLDESEAPEENVFTEAIGYGDLVERSFEAQDSDQSLFYAID